MSSDTRTIVEVHILQTTAPGNLNRDDTGSPKSVIYGGAMRARVSSQAWKRPTREAFRKILDPKDLGVRTKRVIEVLSNRILEQAPDTSREQAIELAETTLRDGAGIKLKQPKVKEDAKNEDRLQESGYLLFLGDRQYDRLAQLAVEALATDNAVATIKQQKKQIKALVADDRAIDVALFGRMVADDSDLNVDATAQVAHALSVQAIEPESDFFTAVDDVKNDSGIDGDSGAAMLGDVEFNAATFYRYANVDVDRLNETLGDPAATTAAVKAFVESFVSSIPQGKINSFAHATLPELVYVTIRDSQAINLVGAFERPVGPDFVANATAALVKREKEYESAYDVTPAYSWVVRVGDDTKAADALVDHTSNLRETLSGLGDVISARLDQE